MIRVFIVDDQALVRAGLGMMIEAQDDMVVNGEAGDGIQALDLLAGSTADVVLMDIRMPRMDGVEATRRLTARTAGKPDAPRVLILTTFDLDDYAFAALRAGASGFLLKDALPEELCSAVRTVHRGDSVIAPSTTRRLIDQVLGDLPMTDPGPDPLAVLTSREREILLAMALGESNSEIAGRLYLSEATVKTHVGRVLAKLGLRDRVHTVIWAYERRLIRPGHPPNQQ